MKIIDAPTELLQAVQYQRQGELSWPEPERIEKPLFPVKPFKKNMLPKALRQRAYDIAYRMQCPVDFPAVTMLVMLGAVIGCGCAVRPKQKDTWSEHPNLWGGIIGAPGSLKSPATSEGFKSFFKLEESAEQEHQTALLNHAANEFYRKNQLELLRKQQSKTSASSGNAVYQQMAQLSREVNKPKIKRYRTHDATVEKLAELNSENPRGILTQRDELVGLLALLQKEGHESDRAFYLEGWNGNHPFTQDRIGRGTISVKRLCFSVFGTIQPGRLQEYMYGSESNNNDGLIQRFQLLVYPDPIKWKLVDEVPNRDAERQVSDIIEALATTDFIGLGAQQAHHGGIPYFHFHPKVQSLVNQWLTDLEQKISKEDNLIIAEHLSKFRKLVPALSLIFHLVEVASQGCPGRYITKTSLQRALLWADYLESHARRIYGMATDYSLLAALSLAKKIKSGELTNGFSERDVYRNGWTYLDAELTPIACRELVDAGWLRQIRQERTGGRPPSPSYLINPKLL